MDFIQFWLVKQIAKENQINLPLYKPFVHLVLLKVLFIQHFSLNYHLINETQTFFFISFYKITTKFKV